MDRQPTPADVIARMNMEQGRRRPAPASPEARRTQTIADNAEAAAKTSGDPMEGFRVAAEGTLSVTADVPTELKRRIGSEITPADPRTPERARLQKAQKYAETNRDFAEKGIDKMGYTPIQIEQERDLFVTTVLDTLPAYKDRPLVEKKSVANKMLRDPQLRAEVARLLSQRLSEADDPHLEQTLQKLRERHAAYETAEAQRKRKQEELDKNIADHRDVVTKLRDFEEDTSTTPPTPGRKLDRISTLEGTEAIARTRLKDLRDDLNALGVTSESQLLALEDRVRRGSGMGTNPDQEAKMEELILQKNDLAELDGLRKERDDLQKQKKELEGKRPDLEFQRDEATRNKALKEAELNDAKAAKTRQETRVVRDMENLFKDAALSYIENDASRKAGFVQAELQKAIEAAETEEEAAMLRGLANRWDKDKKVWTKRGRKTIKEFDKQHIDQDFSTLMKSGPEGVVVEALVAGGMDRDVAKERVKDKEFMEKHQGKIVERLMTRKIQTGKLNASEARVISESEWGRGMIMQAIRNKAGLREELGELAKEGVLQGGLEGYLKNMDNKGLLRLLLLLFGGGALMMVNPVLGVGVAAGGAVAEVRQSKLDAAA